MIMLLNDLHPPFDNPKVRQAVLLALDQQSFVEAVVGDQKDPANVPTGLFAPTMLMAASIPATKSCVTANGPVTGRLRKAPRSGWIRKRCEREAAPVEPGSVASSRRKTWSTPRSRASTRVNWWPRFLRLAGSVRRHRRSGFYHSGWS